MEIEPLIEKLNSKTENEYKFMLKSATLDSGADFCVLEILYRDGIILTPEKKNEFEEIIKSILPKKFKYDIRFIKNFISEERIEGEFEKFMEKNFPSISYSTESVELNNYTFTIKVNVDDLSFEHANKKNLDFAVQKYLKSKFEDFDFVCNYTKQQVFKEDEKELLKQNYVEEEVDFSELRKIEVSDQVVVVGENIELLPSYIKDKQAPEGDVVLCGKVKSKKEIVIKRKLKEVKEESENSLEKNKQTEESEKATQDEADPIKEVEKASQTETGENTEEKVESKAEADENAEGKYQRKLYKWVLEDFTGSISCVFFSNKENQPKLAEIEDGQEILVRGKIENDKYSGDISFVVSSISTCKLPEKFEEKIVYHEEKPFYEWVEPEKIVTYQQNDLMTFMEEKHIPEMLKGKTYVCYDFETTGLHYEAGDKIIEIGAVKIEDGKITQRFMSYVDPERPIPPESSAISGIVDSDVAGAPKDYQVLQDFYKFTRGAIIIGYNNINFDNIFLIGQGKKCRWNFSDNETDDVYRYAQKYVHGVKNYKLGTIADNLGVTLDNAHRAVYDALATAEVFLKLAERVK